MLEEIYGQPLFLLHLAIFWVTCCVCLVQDLRIESSVPNQIKAKYASDKRLVDLTNSRVTSLIDWNIYFWAIGYALMTQFLFLAPSLALVAPFYRQDSVWDVPIYQIVISFVLCLLFEEIFFYYLHRLFHTRDFWKYHQLHHELTTPVAIATLYASPLENLLVNVIPVVLSPLLSRVPVGLLWIWTLAATLSRTLSHSGFKSLEWVAKFHAIHHTHKTGNFSVFGLMDWLHGSYRSDSHPPTATQTTEALIRRYLQ